MYSNYNERDDLALERDRAYENRPPSGYTRWEDYHADEEARLNATSYGTASTAKLLSQWIEEMLQAKCYGKLLLKSEVIWSDELSVNEALDDACIALGLDPEEEGLAASYHDQGNEIDLRLVP